MEWDQIKTYFIQDTNVGVQMLPGMTVYVPTSLSSMTPNYGQGQTYEELFSQLVYEGTPFNVSTEDEDGQTYLVASYT